MAMSGNELWRAIMDHLNDEEEDLNAAVKVAPVISSDCRYNYHSSCEGSEPALWPDGDFTVRPCCCPCHDGGADRAPIGR